MPTFLTLDQVAEIARVPRETARYWTRSGKLRAFRPGRKVIVREEDLLEMIERYSLAELRKREASRARKVVVPK
jgi:excisionase family DNA binding protein